MAISWLLPVRGVQALCALIVLGTAANTVAVDPLTFATGDYNIFVALWTLLICAFFIITSFVGSDSVVASPIVSLVLDGLSWVFWLAAFASMAAALHDYGDEYDDYDNFFGCIKASIAFGVIEWFLFTATLVFNALSGRKSKSSGAA